MISRYLLTHPYNKVLISIGTFSFYMLRYFIIYKPYLVLSQFTSDSNKHRTLKDVFNVPNDVYAVGRLDTDSEGLLILTNDRSINQRLLHPGNRHTREYWVQVDGAITPEAIAQLQKGVDISVDGKIYRTLPCEAAAMQTPVLPERTPPIRFRKEIPTSWLSLQLVEGKNRQVRKMTARVGFPTLRLVRYRIGQLTIEGLQPGDIRELSREDIFQRIFP